MSLVLGKNPSNELKEIELTNSGNLKVDLAGSSGGAISANVDITGNTIGLATDTTLNSRASEATLLSADSYLSSISTDTLNLDSKITQGYDAQVASGGNGLSQNLVYGRDASGNLDALLTDASGHLEVVVDDFVKGQANMANSFPVVASDQSAISVSSAGGNTTNVAETLATLAGGTATSTAVDMDGSTNLTIFGQTDNNTDAIEVLVSHDNSTYYTDPSSFVATQPSGSNTDFSIQISSSGARYFKIRQVDTLTTAFTVVVNSSKK